MPMKPGMKMVLMEQIQRKSENNRSEYGGGNRRMIGFERGANGNAETRRYGMSEGGSMNYGAEYGGGGSNYAENRMENRMEDRMEGGGYSNYGGNNRMEYGMEGAENRRRRDSRGRYTEGEGYQNNRNYGEGYGRNETESRRRRDSRGRYMMEGMEDDEETEMRGQHWYPPYGNSPQMMYPGNSYGDIYARGTIYAPGAANKPMQGGMEEEMMQPIDEHTARKWVKKMDGGEHYKPEQLEQLRNSLCPDCDMWSFYVAINAMYSDYCETAKRMGVDRAEFYGGLAKDFLKDKDAKPHKLRRYMEYIAK